MKIWCRLTCDASIITASAVGMRTGSTTYESPAAVSRMPSPASASAWYHIESEPPPDQPASTIRS
ncbi:MAG: hypothetical protein RIB65_04315 [Ilumatobacter fluminis]